MEAPRSTDQLAVAIDKMTPAECIRILMRFDPWFVGQVGRPAKRVEEVILQAQLRRVIKRRA